MLASVPAPAETLTGRVVDPSGRPLPRAYVHIISPAQPSTAGVFTEIDGRFQLETTTPTCTIEVTLTGFQRATAPCADRPIELTLMLAPVREQVIVSATRTETPAGELGVSATAFEEADLERRQFPLVAEVLASSPGVIVANTGAPGGVTSVYVRGGESNYNKVLLDGIPLNEPGGTFNFSNITSDNLERVEIVRGAQSALFGSDAMASVIQLVTARARPGTRLQGSVGVDGGSFGTGRFNTGIRGATGRSDYSVAAAHLTTDNQTANDAFRNTTVSAAAGTRVGTSTEVRGVFRSEIGRTGVPGQTAFGRPDMDAFFDRRDIVGGVTVISDLSPALRQRVAYALSTSRQQSANLTLDPPYTPIFAGHQSPFEFFDFAYDSRTRLHRHYASYQADWVLTRAATGRGTQHATFAIDWDGERGKLSDALAGGDTTASRDNVGVTIEHQASWRRLSATGGLRFEHNASFGNAAVPRASVAFVLHRDDRGFAETRVKTSAGKGIKEPTILQSFSRNDFFLGNPDLQPERSRTIDAGIEQRLGHDRVKLDLTWFDNRFRNIISTRTISFNPFQSQYFNVGAGRAQGVELSGEIAPISALHVRGGYTFTASEVVESLADTGTVFGEGNWLFRRPRHSGYVEASWTRGRTSLDVIGSIVGSRVDSDFSSLEPALTRNGGRTTWDGRASVRLSRHVSITAAVDNIMDASYMEPLGYPALGRAVRMGIRTGF